MRLDDRSTVRLADITDEGTPSVDIETSNGAGAFRAGLFAEDIDAFAIAALRRCRTIDRDDGVSFHAERKERCRIIPDPIEDRAIQPVARRLGVHALSPKNFGAVDVANASHDRLVHDQPSDWGSAPDNLPAQMSERPSTSGFVLTR